LAGSATNWIQTAAIAVLVAAIPLSAQSIKKTDYYVVLKNKQKIYGSALEANEKGDITLTLSGGRGQRKFRKTEIRRAYVPKPKLIKEADRLLKSREFDAALSRIDDAYSKFRHLGWGGRIGYVRGKCYLARNQPKEAEKSLRDGLRYRNDKLTEIRLSKEMVTLLLKDNRVPDAKKIVDQLRVKDAKSKSAILIYNMRGEVLAANGQKKEAILSYMKIILLFPKAEWSGTPRKEAYRQVVSLLRELNDNRAVEFEKEMRSEYP